MNKIFGMFTLMLLVISSFGVVSANDNSNNLLFNTGDLIDPIVCKDDAPIDGQTSCIRFEPRIDVVFLIDSTGSMADEIRSVKTHIVNIVKEVEGGQPSPDLRIGVVTYRDHESEEREYLVRSFDLNDDIDEALEFIKDVDARGGGDYPEAVADGLHAAVNKMNWDDRAIKLIFLIGDAPPHGEGSDENSYVQGCPEGHDYKDAIEEAIEEHIRIFTVSGSGMDSTGIKIWKEIAEETGGDYERLSYIRRDVDQYYEEEGINPEFAVEAKTDRDYDRKSNSILTNSFGKFAKGAVMEVAMNAGVKYDDEDNKKTKIDDDGVVLDKDKTSIITYDEIIEGHVDTETESESKLGSFFKRVFAKISFWK